MVAQTLASAIREQLDRLPPEQQRQVLDFARSLVAAQVRGVPGKELLRFAGSIDADDLKTMKQAIEEACETIDPHEW
jgi:hypothetical protein